MSMNEYLRSNFGMGARFGGPPISAIRDFPHSPGALYGAWWRWGQETTPTDEYRKLEERPADKGSRRSSREGASSSNSWTGQRVLHVVLKISVLPMIHV
jgi:hypothetical protein